MEKSNILYRKDDYMKNIIRFTFVITISLLLFSCSTNNITDTNNSFSYPGDIIYEGSYTMNTNPTMPLVVVVEDTLNSIGELSFEDDPWLSKEDITIESNILVIDKSVFVDKEGPLNVSIQTDRGIIKLLITITDNTEPHFISETNFTYNGETIILFFEPLQGELISLSGNEIDNNDYVVEGNKITISQSFIENILDNDLDRDTIIIGYQMLTGNHITIGYIFIQNPELE